ncbi:uncharacterized protein DEA37_0005406 [Paragonimus westermani]|uniref:Peptidase aspartic putative domain-containing protein n=1 Tax=Paragonimus westermani TaxID=34504 RepID=A0A5J4P4U6_9TREM|nr:uncharacterized protein DEA37_0005406 [Paragonimus westermani]
MLHSTSGLQRARKILSELFGQNHHVARSLLDRLLNNPNVVVNSSDALSALAIKMESCHNALTEMNYVADLNSLSTLKKISRNLPKPLQYQWAESVDKITLGGREPDFLNLLEFVSSRARVARIRFGQLASLNKRISRYEERLSNRNAPERKPALRSSIYSNQSNEAFPKTLTCQLCKGNHELSNCGEFAVFGVPVRWAVVKAERIWFMCLESGQRIYDCRIRRKRGVENYGAGHPILLHGVRHLPTESTEGAACANCRSTNTAQRGVILGMILVRVVGPTEDVLTYAFLDSGSDTTLGEVAVERAHSVPSLRMKPPADAIQNEICKWPHLDGVPLGAVPDKRVSILIGNDIPDAHLVLDQRLGDRKQPYAVKTLLGWMVLTPLGSYERGLSVVNCLERADASIVEQIKRLYSDEFADTENFACPRSMEDDSAVRAVRNTTQLTDGHYAVRLH